MSRLQHALASKNTCADFVKVPIYTSKNEPLMARRKKTKEELQIVKVSADTETNDMRARLYAGQPVQSPARQQEDSLHRLAQGSRALWRALASRGMRVTCPRVPQEPRLSNDKTNKYEPHRKLARGDVPRPRSPPRPAPHHLSPPLGQALWCACWR